MKFNKSKLSQFLEAALQSNCSYYAAKRELFALWAAAIDPADGDLDVPNTLSVQMRSFLTTKPDATTSDARLAFEVGLARLSELAWPPSGE